MLDFWGWLIGEERFRCVPEGVRRVASATFAGPSPLPTSRWPFPTNGGRCPKSWKRFRSYEAFPRGGLQQALKALIDAARMRVVAKLGTAKEQGVALKPRGSKSRS
jgi:hypothetical protein